MTRSDDYDTAEMLKRLQRQVSRLQGAGEGDSVTIFQLAEDTASTSDAVYWGDYSVAFDGLSSGDYIEMADSASLDITGDITLAFTAKVPEPLDVDSNNNYRGVLGKPDQTGPYDVTLEEGGAVSFTVTKGGSREYVSGGSVPLDGTVFTVVCTHDTSTGESVVYIDGGAATSGTVATGSVDSTADPVYVSTTDSAHQPLMTIDRIRVDSRAWTPAEADLYYTGGDVDAGSRRLELNLTAGSGTVATDTSGNGNDGSFVGSPEWVAPLSWERNLGFVWSVSSWSHQSW